MIIPTLALTLTFQQALQEQPFQDPGPNKVVWVTSPHFNARPADAEIDTIVLHHTAGDSLAGTVKWFEMEKSQVSAHFTVGKDGSIVQMVSTFDRAWHAGASEDIRGRTNVNNFSIGIEIVNIGDGTHPYPQAQVDAVHHLCAFLIRHRFPGIKQITSHEFIAKPFGRKNDPINYPWDSLKDLGVPLNVDVTKRTDGGPDKKGG